MNISMGFPVPWAYELNRAGRGFINEMANCHDLLKTQMMQPNVPSSSTTSEALGAVFGKSMKYALQMTRLIENVVYIDLNDLPLGEIVTSIKDNIHFGHFVAPNLQGELNLVLTRFSQAIAQRASKSQGDVSLTVVAASIELERVLRHPQYEPEIRDVASDNPRTLRRSEGFRR